MDRNMAKELALSLLDDDQGINEQAMDNLRIILTEYNLDHILDAVKATDGRFYLPIGFSND